MTDIVVSPVEGFFSDGRQIWRFIDAASRETWDVVADSEQEAIAILDSVVNPVLPAPKLDNVGLALNKVIQKLVDHGVTQIGEIEPVKPDAVTAQPSEADPPVIL